MNINKKTLLTSIMVFMMTSCTNTQQHSMLNMSMKYTSMLDRASHAFVFLSIISVVTRSCPDSKVICEQEAIRMSATGIVVKKHNNRIKMITANHFCEDHVGILEKVVIENEKKVTYTLTTILNVLDHSGKILTDSLVVATDKSSDLCLIDATSQNINDIEALQLADSEPERYTTVYNIAAPLALYSPGSPLAFSGIYVGMNIRKTRTIVTIPVNPGSSGSMLIDQEGRLFSVILELAHRNFSHVALGAPLENIKKILVGH